MDAPALKADLRDEGHRLGFVACGVTSARPFTEARARAMAAIDAGRMDGMAWYTRERVEGAADIGGRYPWARSIIALAWPYRPARAPGREEPAPENASSIRGRFAAYACIPDADRAVDYHDLLARRCDALVGWLRGRVGGLRAKRFVDHGWAFDRAIAERAGIGFAGKHSSLITTAAGSYVMLAGIAVSVTLPVDPPSRRGCGQCRACIPACPTGAIVAPGVIDATRCISYLTIEHRGAIAPELRPLMGTWAFGCDLCQEACPINHRLAPAPLDHGTASTERGPVPYPGPRRMPPAHRSRVRVALPGDGRLADRSRRAGAELRDRARQCGESGGAAGAPAERRV